MAEIDYFCKKEVWDAYATSHESGLFSHLFAWGDSFCSVYNLKIFRIAARQPTNPKQITGMLPLIFFNAPGRENRLISLPYTDAAGVLADDTKTEARLVSAALQLADDLDVPHVELRRAGPNGWAGSDQHRFDPDFYHQPFDFKVGLRRRLPPSVPELWQDLGPKVRNQIRKAEKNGCRIVIGHIDLLDRFYTVFSENMRDLGSPVHHKTLFTTLADRFGDSMRCVGVVIGNAPVAASIVFRHRSTLYNPWASSLRRFRPVCPNMLLYWAMLCHAVETGSRVFDFGRSSPQAGTCRFKLQWGARMTPLTWHVYSRKPRSWDPGNETLVSEQVKALSLKESVSKGPGKRKWISL